MADETVAHILHIRNEISIQMEWTLMIVDAIMDRMLSDCANCSDENVDFMAYKKLMRRMPEIQEIEFYIAYCLFTLFIVFSLPSGVIIVLTQSS